MAAANSPYEPISCTLSSTFAAYDATSVKLEVTAVVMSYMFSPSIQQTKCSPSCEGSVAGGIAAPPSATTISSMTVTPSLSRNRTLKVTVLFGVCASVNSPSALALTSDATTDWTDERENLPELANTAKSVTLVL